MVNVGEPRARSCLDGSPGSRKLFYSKLLSWHPCFPGSIWYAYYLIRHCPRAYFAMILCQILDFSLSQLCQMCFHLSMFLLCQPWRMLDNNPKFWPPLSACIVPIFLLLPTDAYSPDDGWFHPFNTIDSNCLTSM